MQYIGNKTVFLLNIICVIYCHRMWSQKTVLVVLGANRQINRPQNCLAGTKTFKQKWLSLIWGSVQKQ